MICPNCQSEQNVTEHQYGALYTCASCQAVYFINFDGQPEFGEASSEEYASANAANLQEAASLVPASTETIPFELGSLEPQLAVNETLEPVEAAEPQTRIDSYIAEFNASGAPEQTTDNPFELQNNLEPMNPEPVVSPVPTPAPTRAPLPKVDIEMPVSPVKSVGIKPDFSAKPQAASNMFADIAQEISDFANTDSQLAGLNYDVVISGIDTQETKMLFKEAIEDSKFAWDAFELMKSVKNGRIEIYKMSPAKAFLLAKRIQFLDIEKNWKQNVLS
ncbi:MAG: hypothetical protein ACXVAX_08200 [Pseudobdellovibrio sp.]